MEILKFVQKLRNPIFLYQKFYRSSTLKELNMLASKQMICITMELHSGLYWATWGNISFLDILVGSLHHILTVERHSSSVKFRIDIQNQYQYMIWLIPHLSNMEKDTTATNYQPASKNSENIIN